MTTVAPPLCVECNENPLTGKQKSYCSPRCARDAAHRKRMESGKLPAQRIARREKIAEYNKANRDKWQIEKPCSICGDPTVIRNRYDGRPVYCSDECRRSIIPVPKVKDEPEPVLYSKACARCRDPYLTYCGWQRYCTGRCMRRAKEARRDVLLRGAFVEDVYPPIVFERDAFECWLCNEALDMTAEVPHPKAPTLDHVIPLGAGHGGTHEYANVKAAHFLCNSTRGARV